MADIKEEIVTTKDTGPATIKFPMLTSSNYTIWSMRMKIALKFSEVWETIDPGTKDEKKNNMAIAFLFQSIPEALILQVGDIDTAKGVWDAIKARHVGAERVKEARLQTLMADFDRLKMKDKDTIDSFAGKLSEISSKSAFLGEIIEEPKLVKKFLKSLPRKKFIHIVASLEQVLDLNTTSFEEIIRRLKAYEERVTEEEEAIDGSEKLMYANSDSSTESYGTNSRGRGRGGRSKWRGRVLKLQETVEKRDDDTHEADALMMNEVVYLNERKVNPKKFEAESDTVDVWYLDNGASNHMSGNRMFFCELDDTVTGKVQFGDDSKIDTMGKGSIYFITKGGEKKVLNNIYYIPALRSNIVSLGKATEVGCEVRKKEDTLSLFD
ncbi:uncharacterized protein LOC125582998 [Brassica napus]|uniref:uncharacterized protein LOC125582998 n=1 Tax=Brassica napus TaxID=3708 RepID=UPI0020786FB2|nr:uncharacterized protein LOC125582998 [Brassica napus]